MRNKILIVDRHTKDREALERILQEVVDEGGELFFAKEKDDALAIIAKENPQLVFLDMELIGEKEDEWVATKAHIIVMCTHHKLYQKSEDILIKPLKSHQVLEKTRAVLAEEASPQMPPM